MIKKTQIQPTEFLCFGESNDFNRRFLFVFQIWGYGLIQRLCNNLTFSHICLEVKERKVLFLHFFPLDKYTYPMEFS